eukprot:CAMPEP_0170329504 /NCGR_PEP_ID=MMETSP0116_2-20130129/65668_1 /TAXON_ID=400756 /ORGANISM="Durinskia baltica, Strain CSIRO CS-38" /LENGTH=75 /DNA_ID=CAMNT_0010582639 /DNA_START=1 /DNA_END=225 /DNA_ORIENTATION=-
MSTGVGHVSSNFGTGLCPAIEKRLRGIFGPIVGAAMELISAATGALGLRLLRQSHLEGLQLACFLHAGHGAEAAV